MKISKLLTAVLIVFVFMCNTSANSAEKINITDGSVYTVESDTSFEGLDYSSDGGAIYNKNGTLIINSNVTFSENSSNYGGAVENDSTMTSTSDTYSQNTASYAGGAIYNAGSLTSSSNTYSVNSAASHGGAIYNYGSLTSTLDEFINNEANYGGAIYNRLTLSVSNAYFGENTANVWGGAIYNNTSDAATIENSEFNSNEAVLGGAIMNYAGTITSNGNTYTSNSASAGGGAIYNNTDSTFNSVSDTYSYNTSAGSGGAIYNDEGILSVNSADFSYNSADKYGGAIESYLGTITITNSTFSNNSAGSDGGAIDNYYGTLQISNSTFDSNYAETNGGAISIYYDEDYTGTTTISNSTFTSNSTSTTSDDAKGGAIWIMGGVTNISNSTFEGNSSYQGGAIASVINSDAMYDATVNISNSVFTENTAATAGAIANFRTMYITDSTFTGNSATSTIEDEGGGAIYLGAKSETYISGSTFTSNTAAENGGAISMRINADNSDAILDIINSTFDSNTASANGGAIYNTFYNSNTNEGYVTVSGSTFTNNSAANGGAIYNSEIIDKGESYGSIYVTDSTFTSNSASENGGAIYNSENTTGVVLTSDFTSNSAANGGAIYNAGNLEITNSSFLSNQASSMGGAIYTAADLTINSTDGYQTVFSGNSASQGSAIYVDNAEAALAFNLTSSASVLLEDDINGQTGYDVNITGDSTSTTFYLYNDITNADVSIGNTTLNTVNGQIYAYNFNSFTLTDSINMAVDVDLANETMDRITASNYGNHNGTLTVTQMNLLSGTSKDSVAVYFAEQGLKNNVANGVSSVYTPIYKYNVSYDNRDDGGYFVFSKDSVNPSVMAGAVAAQVGGYLTELNSFDEAFRNMDMYMLMTRKEREALKFRNKFASSTGYGITYEPGSGYQAAQGWARPYATFESVDLRGGADVSNVAYGSFFGADSELKEFSNGWDGVFSVYGGYNGSHQAYDGISIYQNGGTLGAVGMAYKGNFFTGLTANVGANAGRASTYYGNEDFTLLMAGIASKTGYNVEFADGKFIVQPQYLMSYSFVNTFDYTNSAGLKIKSDPLHAIQIAPGVKFIGNFENGWQPYASVSMIWNIIDKTKFTAADVALPELSIKPYVKYGVGVQKRWGDRFIGYFQTYITNGGRNGVGLQAGFSLALGKKYF
ncbi:MAG: hypothetical protein LUE64_00615 [Candidatus Gastranaerophilales bacterium]|nr:hypothetical protein [Candidatus Gastranaerophilales bacterium]